MMPRPFPNQLARPYTSVIPQAIDALMQAARAVFAAQLAAGGDRVYVRGGPWTAAESGGPFAQDLAVCWYGFYPGYQYPTRALSEELGEAVVSARNELSGLGPSQTEMFTIGCGSMCLYGGETTDENWSKLRHIVYGNIATLASGLADPQIGGLYLGNVVQQVTVASQNTMHQVAGRAGILAITTFALDCTSVSQQLCWRSRRPRRCANTVIRGLTGNEVRLCLSLRSGAAHANSGRIPRRTSTRTAPPPMVCLTSARTAGRLSTKARTAVPGSVTMTGYGILLSPR